MFKQFRASFFFLHACYSTRYLHSETVLVIVQMSPLIILFLTTLLFLSANHKLSVSRQCFGFGAALRLLHSLSLTHSFPACTPLCPTALPTFGVLRAHPGGEPPSCEGCCRDARSPGPRRTRGWESDAPPQPSSRDRERDRHRYRHIPTRRQRRRQRQTEGRGRERERERERKKNT